MANTVFERGWLVSSIASEPPKKRGSTRRSQNVCSQCHAAKCRKPWLLAQCGSFEIEQRLVIAYAKKGGLFFHCRALRWSLSINEGVVDVVAQAQLVPPSLEVNAQRRYL